MRAETLLLVAAAWPADDCHGAVLWLAKALHGASAVRPLEQEGVSRIDDNDLTNGSPRTTRGTFARGNTFASRTHRKPTRVTPLMRVRRVAPDIVVKLQGGTMQPVVANALVLGCRFELELIERIEIATNVEVLQGEIDRLTEQIRNLLDRQAAHGAH